jgi:pSer/pThr/pTyr-binding forkhead associated (FHA) protein
MTPSDSLSGPILLILRIALSAALYGFLGWAFYTLWKDLQRQARSVALPQVPPLTLIHDLGGDQKQLRFAIPEITIGRDPACDLHIEDKTISAKHARLSFHHSQWWVEDLRSTNGTYLNQEPVTEPLVLTAGDQLRCGQMVLEIAFGGGSSNGTESGV